MGSVVSGLFGGGGSDAAKDAGAVQAQASKEAIEEQRRQFDISQENIQPYLGAGIPALEQYMALLGLGGTPSGGQQGFVSGSNQIQPPLSYEDWVTREQNKTTRPLSSPSSRLFGKEPEYQGGETYYVPDQWGQDIVDKKGYFRRSDIPQRIAEEMPWVDFTKFSEGDYEWEFESERDKAQGGQGGMDTSREAYEAYLAGRQGGGGGGQFGGQSALDAQQAAMASLVESPGQRFIRDRAQRALLQGSAAVGGIGGGNVRSALVQQGAGFAQQDLENRYGRLQNLISGGQNSAIGLANLGQQSASNIGNLLQSGAQARASGILGAQQAKSDAFGNLVSLGSTLYSAGIFSDKRLKENIDDLDLKSCFEAVTEMPLMSWRYLESVGLDTETHIGPMAQDAPDMIRMEDMSGIEMLNLHDELMMIAGALQYMKREGMIKCH